MGTISTTLENGFLISKIELPSTWKLEAISTRSPQGLFTGAPRVGAVCIYWLIDLITTCQGRPLHLPDPKDGLVNPEVPEVRHQGHLNQAGIGQGS